MGLVAFPASSIQHPASSILQPAFSSQHSAASIQQPAPRNQHSATSFQNRVLGFQYRVSGLDSHVNFCFFAIHLNPSMKGTFYGI